MDKTVFPGTPLYPSDAFSSEVLSKRPMKRDRDGGIRRTALPIEDVMGLPSPAIENLEKQVVGKSDLTNISSMSPVPLFPNPNGQSVPRGSDLFIRSSQDPINFTSLSPTRIVPGTLNPFNMIPLSTSSLSSEFSAMKSISNDSIGDGKEEQRYNIPGFKRQKVDYSGYYDFYRDRQSLSQPTLPVASIGEDVCKITRATRNEYKKFCGDFLSSWVKDYPSPPRSKNISVYVITNPSLKRKWQAYKGKLSDTTVETHYHGTKLCCNISSLQLCKNESCGICGIAQKGFDPLRMGTNIPKFKRFGKAFYLAPNSSKCHDYTVGYGQHRAMLCFRVLPGRKRILKKTNEKFALPQGFDSAYGEPGQSLNYPELMLYQTEAALPVCIITYMKEGIEQIAK